MTPKYRESNSNDDLVLRISRCFDVTIQPPCASKDKMAASLQRIGIVTSRIFTGILQRNLQTQRIRDWKLTPIASVLRVTLRSSSSSADGTESPETVSRYADSPWEYLKSEGTHGDIMGMGKRGDDVCGNPCPICRDPNVIIHHKNVNLLQQFICPYTGIVYDPTRTGSLHLSLNVIVPPGVCMKQQKLLNQAVDTARDHGLLPLQLPHVDYSKEDYSNMHGAVGQTPAPSSLTSGELWYPWYGHVEPDERELARVKRIYKAYLK
ncbi:28S ribosomal protein S18b, mitochondrial [Triplophysa tibetana]|uniref:Small ribosomal subunit protein mS40 n=1 Tax=Triplophysa tibetana TaxID=1572043 RepID=A0A5A9NNX9_9TELE|nr:28S ribosomal protein S18b, mitochondrial [Triplophysa tibetana]